jgi:hypothetical protein
MRIPRITFTFAALVAVLSIAASAAFAAAITGDDATTPCSAATRAT